ncbi:MAG: hypothetical protein DMG55_31025, partial [Acidobacteria bacterium]
MSEVNTSVLAPATGPAKKRTGCGPVSLHPAVFLLIFAYGNISPGDDSSQSLLFLAARFFL